MPETGAHVIVSGRVQGVGFRATVRQVAAGFKVKGWVKNLPDGSVEMLAAAEAAELEAFMAAVRNSQLRGHIDREVQDFPPLGDLAADFEIRYS